MSITAILITLGLVGALFYFGLVNHRNELLLENAPKHEQKAQVYRADIARAEEAARKANETISARQQNVQQGMQPETSGN